MRRPSASAAADMAPGLLVVALLVWAVVVDGGYAITRWAPVGVVASVLLAARLVVAPPAWRAVPRATVVAVGALGLYTAWSGLSVLWAQDQGVAWVGADRTLLYLVVFALLALWPLPPARAGAVAVTWSLAVAVLGVVTVVHAAGVADPLRLLIDDRLLGPGGYVNASTALWLMALWPALLVAAAPRTPWALRGVLAGAGVVLCDLALLSQSRGSLIALPLTAIGCLIALPGRVRLAVILLGVGAGVAGAASALLDVGVAVRAGRSPAPALEAAATTTVLSAAIVGAIVAAGGLLLTLRVPGRATAQRAHRAGGAALAAAAVVAVVAGLVVVGSPTDAASRTWDSFKGGYAQPGSANRLTTGLGSNRYDFYRVGLVQMRRHLLAGTGADNFRAAYLRDGRSAETPAYPHSVEIRALVSTGVVGALLLLVFAVALLAAAVSGAAALGTATGVAGGGAFAYWAIHGSADWFWEIAGLGGAAFALAGLAMASLPPRAATVVRHGAIPTRAAGVLVALVAIAALLPPWLAQREVDTAGRVFADDPGDAIAHLRRAASLNPLGGEPLRVEGAAWLRVGDARRAQRAFTRALARNESDFPAVLQLAAIASSAGRRARAMELVARARTLAPRDPVAQQISRVVRAGRRVDLGALQAALAGRARAFGAP